MSGPSASKQKGGQPNDHLVCGVGVDEDGVIPPPSAAVLNAGLVPGGASVWSSLIPGLVPEYYYGGLTSVSTGGSAVPPSSPRPGGNASTAAVSQNPTKVGKKKRRIPSTIGDRTKPEAPIADMAEIEMLWDRISSTVPPRLTSTSSTGTGMLYGEHVPAPPPAGKAVVRKPAAASSSNVVGNRLSPSTPSTTPFGPPSRFGTTNKASSARVVSASLSKTDNGRPSVSTARPSIPRQGRSPSAGLPSGASSPSLPPATPAGLGADQDDSGRRTFESETKSKIKSTQRKPPIVGVNEVSSPPIPTEAHVFNTEGIFSGITATGGIFTVTYPGAVTATSVQPPTMVVATRSTVRSSANNQSQQPMLTSTVVLSNNRQGPSSRTTLGTERGNASATTLQQQQASLGTTKKGQSQTSDLLFTTYANANAGASEASDLTFYTFSAPHAVASGPHTGALRVPIVGGSDINAIATSVSGVVVGMASPTQLTLVPEEAIADRAEHSSGGRRSFDGGSGGSDRFVPRPPRRLFRGDPSRPERLPAGQRHAAAQQALKVAQESLGVSAERKVGHTMLILHEREAAQRERALLEKRIEELTAIYNKATEEHTHLFSEAQQRNAMELAQHEAALREAQELQSPAEKMIQEERETLEALEKAGEGLIRELRDHNAATKALAREHMQERAQLTATMTNRLRRTFEEMRAVTVSQKAEREGRAFHEAARLGKELTVLDKTNRDLTAKLAAVRNEIASTTRDLELEEDRHGLLKKKNNKLTSKVAQAVAELRAYERDMGVAAQQPSAINNTTTTHTKSSRVAVQSPRARGRGNEVNSSTRHASPSHEELAAALQHEREATDALNRRLASIYNELAYERVRTEACRSALMDRLQWRTRAPNPAEVMRSLKAVLSAKEENAALSVDTDRSEASSMVADEPRSIYLIENAVKAPEPDVETKPKPSEEQHQQHRKDQHINGKGSDVKLLSLDDIKGLLPIAAIVQESLEEIAEAIRMQRQVALQKNGGEIEWNEGGRTMSSGMEGRPTTRGVFGPHTAAGLLASSHANARANTYGTAPQPPMLEGHYASRIPFPQHYPPISAGEMKPSLSPRGHHKAVPLQPIVSSQKENSKAGDDKQQQTPPSPRGSPFAPSFSSGDEQPPPLPKNIPINVLNRGSRGSTVGVGGVPAVGVSSSLNEAFGASRRSLPMLRFSSLSAVNIVGGGESGDTEGRSTAGSVQILDLEPSSLTGMGGHRSPSVSCSGAPSEGRDSVASAWPQPAAAPPRSGNTPAQVPQPPALHQQAPTASTTTTTLASIMKDSTNVVSNSILKDGNYTNNNNKDRDGTNNAVAYMSNGNRASFAGSSRHVRISECPPPPRCYSSATATVGVGVGAPLLLAGGEEDVLHCQDTQLSPRTRVTSVESLLDITDPTDKRLIQDFIIRRINKKLAQAMVSP